MGPEIDENKQLLEQHYFLSVSPSGENSGLIREQKYVAYAT
jgi:hypothetical protein